jgi:multiple antibiotic resistance protein
MGDSLTVFTRVAMVTIAALIPIINPAGTAPIFLALTSGATDRARAILASRVARGVCILLSGAMIGGPLVLLFFGLSLVEIRIAGGLLVIATAWHLMSDDQRPDDAVAAISRSAAGDPPAHASFYPLTFPVTIGPGSLSIAVTLGAAGRPAPIASLLGALVGIVIVSLTVYLCYRFAARAAKLLGSAGTIVLVRLSAFILLAVGVKILCDGIVERFTSGSA